MRYVRKNRDDAFKRKVWLLLDHPYLHIKIQNRANSNCLLSEGWGQRGMDEELRGQKYVCVDLKG